MKQLFDAVIFDLDGTLVDSMWVWPKIDEVYLGRFGFEVPDTLESEFEGMSFTETALYVKERFNIPDDVSKRSGINLLLSSIKNRYLSKQASLPF